MNNNAPGFAGENNCTYAGSHAGSFWRRSLSFALIALAALLLMSRVQAQTVLLSETFEPVFPSFNGWTVGDSNSSSGLAYWDDVNSAYGSIAAHGGSFKAYCAAITNGVFNASARYTNHMRAVMSKALNFSGYSGANLEFWYAIPSIELGWDSFRVVLDNTNVLWTVSATQSTWAKMTLPLNSLVGGTRSVAFEFLADSIVTAEGVYLDDIVVRGSTQPFVASMGSLSNANYSGYVLDSDTSFLGRSNIQAGAAFNVENFTGTNTTYTNVLSFRLINASTGNPHPIYDFGNATTNAGFTHNVTNVVSLSAGTNRVVAVSAYLRPAAWLNQFAQYRIECRMLTNGVLAQTLLTPATNYYHFTNTVTDPAYNALLSLTDASWSRTYEVQSIPGQDSFQVNANYQVRRWDDVGTGTASHNIPIIFNYTLRDSAGVLVPLTSSREVYLESVPNYTVFIFTAPALVSNSRTLNIRPANQLDSVGRTYYLTVSISHTNNPVSGQVIAANSELTSTNRLLDFNGNLFFGSIGTTMDALVGIPPVNPPSGGFIPTTLGNASGHVTASAGHTYSGGPILVNLNGAGDAFVTGGSVVLNAPIPDNDVVANVRFQRGPITLSSSGASGAVKVTLPTGFGYRTNDIASPVLYSMIQFPPTALNPALAPASDLTFAPGVTIYAAEESKPAWLVADKILWRIPAGRFELNPTAQQAFHVRAQHYAYLSSVSNSLVDPPNMGDKKSNDKYWLAANGLSAAAVVRASAASNALLSVSFNFDPAGFRTHFPYNSVVVWSGPGNMKVTDDLVTPGSELTGSATVGVSYSRDCADCPGAGGGLVAPRINPTNGVLSFTRDGGIAAGGPTTTGVSLQWGRIAAPINDYAQQARLFTEAAFHMPGAFLRGDQNLLPRIHGPSTILYSGVAVSNLTVIERPGSVGYTLGYADYAGLNFRCLEDSAHPARSTIAGKTNINWELAGRSKYYVRWSGVSGIHESVPGTFPEELTLWGYDFTFTSYGLSYLDSQNKDSRTDGAVDLPYPSDFIQGFDNMKFSCLGAPVSADLPEGEGFKMMAYWVADFKTHSIQFKSNNGCDPGTGFLVLGIEGYASHIKEPLFGYVGLFNSGDQIPRSFGLNGVYSRLKLPNVIELAGPNKTTYKFTPVADAFYNTHSNAPPAPTAGWMNIFGKLDIPFFEDMQLHFQTSCRTNGVTSSNAPIYLSGGWPRAGTSNPNYGWLESGVTPFQTNHFDWGNRGWPKVGGLTIDNYRDNDAGQEYHPRAQRLWLDVVDFDYALSWNRTLRSFKSWEQTKNDFFVLQVQHEVKYMDAKQAELTFGAQYDGLPQISIANVAFNAIDEATGMGSAIVKAATQPIFDVLTSGLDQMDQILDTQMDRLMDGVFDRTIDPIIDNWYGSLSNQWASTWNSLPVAQRQQFLFSVSTNLTNFFIGRGPGAVAGNMSAALREVGSAAGEANNLIGQVHSYLGNATQAICSIIGTVNMNTNGQALGSNVVGLLAREAGERVVLPGLVENIVGEIAPEFIGAVLGPTLDGLIDEVEPALQEITGALEQTKDAIHEVDKELDAAGQFVAEIDNTIKSLSSELTNVSIQVSLSVTQYFGDLNYAVDNPFQHLTATEIKQFVRQKVEDQFYGTEAASKVQSIMRQQLYDLDAKMKEGIDSAFQQVNDMMRGLISQSLAEVDNTINEALGDISDTIGAGQINGHALIVGDSLKMLRLDAKFQWKVPEEMEFSAFLLVKEIDSDGSPGCVSSNAPWTEVTIGAERVSLDWISPDLAASIQTKFTFDGTVPFPVNMAGQLELHGTLDFETFELYDLAAALAFGKYENYLAMKGGVRFNSYDFSGAIFLGRTCSLDPIKLVDPDVAEVLGNPPFTGGYVYAQGWLPVSELVLGIPASCLFNISAGVGAGAFYFAEGPTYGGKMFLGVSGELLCIVSIQGDITMIGVKQGDDLRFKGHGHFEAEVGPCPFCISISKSVDIQYIDRKWSID